MISITNADASLPPGGGLRK